MANNFTVDPGCKALWKFEDGALTADSIGTNTLTPAATPVADLADFQEGAACVDLEYGDGDYFTITDANLDAGFPLKNGDSAKKLTWCAWIKQESQTPTIAYILSKYDTVNSKRSLALATASNVLTINWGYGTGTAYETINTGIAIANGEWYHVALAIDGVTKAISVRVYKLSTTTVYTYSTTATNVLNVEDADFRVGARGGDTQFRFDGKIDEVVIFNYCLTAAQIDTIRAGTFPVYEYAGQASLTLTPQSSYGGPHQYEGNLLLRLIPVSSYELFNPIAPVAVISTGGVEVSGSDTVSVTLPTISNIVSTGGVEVGGSDTIQVLTPAVTDVQSEGGVAVSLGGLATAVTPEALNVQSVGGVEVGGLWPAVVTLPTLLEVISQGGIVVKPLGISTVTFPSALTVSSKGGVVVGGIRFQSITIATPILVTLVGMAGLEVGGVSSASLTTPNIYAVANPSPGQATTIKVGCGGPVAFIHPAILNVISQGGVVIGNEPEMTAEVFETYVLNGSGFGASIFSGFAFNSYAIFQGRTYAAGEDGLFLLEGQDDDGVPIHPGVQIGPMNFGTDRKKRLRNLRLGESGSEAEVHVTVDGDQEGYFEVTQGRATISRNLEGKEFTLDISDFEALSQVEMVPLVLAKR